MEVLTNITHTHTPLATPPLRFHLSSQGANIFVGGMVAMVGDLSWRGGAMAVPTPPTARPATR